MTKADIQENWMYVLYKEYNKSEWEPLEIKCQQRSNITANADNKVHSPGVWERLRHWDIWKQATK